MNELNIKVLMADGCTRDEAIKHLKNSTIVMSEQEYLNYFDDNLVATYCGNVDIDDLEEQRKFYKDLYDKRDKSVDCGWVICEDGWYFIEYCL